MITNRLRTLFPVLTALGLLAGAVEVAAGQAVTVTTATQIDFGNVIAGSSVLIRPIDPTAGKFVIRSTPNATVRLRFTLPAAMNTLNGVMPVTFGPNAAAWSTVNQAAGSTPFDPANDILINVPHSREIYVWIGARIAPPGTQQAGLYAGNITLTVERL